MDSQPTQTTSVQNSGPSNPDVSATASRLAKLISGAADTPAQAFDQNLFAGAGGDTQGAWALGKTAATDPNYSAGVQGGIDSLSKTAAGDYVGSVDPNFEAALNRASNGLTADVNASIGADGRYGSNVHTQALTDQVGGMRQAAELGNLQQQKTDQLNAIPALTNLFSAKQAPAAALGAVGAAEDANSQGNLQGLYDLFTRQQNAVPDWIAKLTSAAAGNAAGSGTTTTNTTTEPAVPWWQQVLGAGAVGAGIYGKLK